MTEFKEGMYGSQGIETEVDKVSSEYISRMMGEFPASSIDYRDGLPSWGFDKIMKFLAFTQEQEQKLRDLNQRDFDEHQKNPSSGMFSTNTRLRNCSATLQEQQLSLFKALQKRGFIKGE